jgi:hypothetical protein
LESILFTRPNTLKRTVILNGKAQRHPIGYIQKYTKHCFAYRNESFTTKVFGTSILEMMVRDHNKLADSDIGEVSFNVAENVDEGRSFDGWLSLTPAGNGEIHIQVEVIST